MISLRLSEIARELGLPQPGQDPVLTSIVVDSRKVDYGCLFAALPGSRVDGHDFARSAADMGALAVLVNRHVDLAVPQLVVGDVLAALGRIAQMIRVKLDPLVVGITGSNGKTTVKEMLASILRQQSEVLATEGNFNNELGVPLTLFRLQERHRYAVLELGASKAGDIAALASIARPDIGVITNIGPAHLQGFGSEEGVARAKGELYAALPDTGCAILNGDQPWCELWRQMNTAGNVLTFGEGGKHDIRIDADCAPARIRTPAGTLEARLKLPGRHNLINAAAATAAAIALEIPLARIRQGLEAVAPVPGRLNLIHADNGWTVIDDTYNANPASLYSALQVLSGLQGTPWLVLGDMKELGEDSHKLHAEVGEAARVLGVSRLFTVGEMSAMTAQAFGHGAQHFDDKPSLIEALKKEMRPGINCLVKGSRSMGMEHVVHAITTPKLLREAC
jgi:UDP-N-acetylmuramoyl-tripeptide--D-alanyl-D-alanine ligase